MTAPWNKIVLVITKFPILLQFLCTFVTALTFVATYK